MPIQTLAESETAVAPVAGFLPDAPAVRVTGRFSLVDEAGEPLQAEAEITIRGALPVRVAQWPDGRLRIAYYRAAGAPLTVSARVRAGIPAGHKSRVNAAIAAAVAAFWAPATGRRKLFECEFVRPEMTPAGDRALLAALRGDLTPLAGSPGSEPRGARLLLSDLDTIGRRRIPWTASPAGTLPAPLAALYLEAGGAARPEAHFERIARQAIAATVLPGEENDYRRLPMRPGEPHSDTLWLRMRAAGREGLKAAVPPAFRDEAKLAPLRADFLAVRWWAAAMARVARAAARIQAGTAPAELLESELAAAAAAAPEELPAGWAEAAIALAAKKSVVPAELCPERIVYATYDQRPGRPSLRAPHAPA